VQCGEYPVFCMRRLENRFRTKTPSLELSF
jgi:hypothetical protein